MGADGLPSEPAPGRGAHPSAQRDAALSVDPRSAGRPSPTAARARRGPRAVRLSTPDGLVEARRLARERETHLPAVWPRRTGGAHEATEEARQSCASTLARADAAQRALEHGLRQRPDGRWPVVPDAHGD